MVSAVVLPDLGKSSVTSVMNKRFIAQSDFIARRVGDSAPASHPVVFAVGRVCLLLLSSGSAKFSCNKGLQLDSFHLDLVGTLTAALLSKYKHMVCSFLLARVQLKLCRVMLRDIQDLNGVLNL